MATQGHNSVSSDELRAFVERIERITDEIAVKRLDVKEVYAEAKSRGYDTKTIRKVIAMKRLDPDKLAEEAAMLDMYTSALGLFG